MNDREEETEGKRQSKRKRQTVTERERQTDRESIDENKRKKDIPYIHLNMITYTCIHTERHRMRD